MFKQRFLVLTSLCLVISVAVVLGLLGFNHGINYFYNQNTVAIKNFNKLAQQVDAPTIANTQLTNLNITTLPQRVSNLWQLSSQLDKYEQLQQQKQQISENFKKEVTSYLNKISSYAEKVQFQPDPNYTEITFATKKDPQQYIHGLKNEFRQAIVKYNKETKQPIRYAYKPKQMLAKMSVQEKVRQMFGFNIVGTKMNIDLKMTFKAVHPGGINLFGDNITGAEQLKSLTTKIKNEYPKIPPFIGIDQEGGVVKRIWWDETAGAKQIAEMSPTEQCNQWQQRTNLLKNLGITWNWGIVADITADPNSFIYQRVYGGNPKTVSKSIKKLTNCSDKIMNTLKHWPGHGATPVDTHQQIATMNSASKQAWQKHEALPFTAGIEAGADAIMIGHLIIPWLDNENPASLSPQAIELLRNHHNFSGLAVTDDLNMLVNAGMKLETVVRKALQAGNDMLLITVAQPQQQQQILDYAIKLVKEESIKEQNINTSIKRILRKKLELLETSEQELVPAEYVY